MPMFINHATTANPVAIHMNANIFVPITAPILISVLFVMTLRKMTNIIVAMTEATKVKIAAKNVRTEIGAETQREYRTTKLRSEDTKQRTVPIMNDMNIA